MPKSAATDAGHGVFTDHSIPRDARRSRAKDVPRGLVAFLGISDNRGMGIAYAEAGDSRAREFLRNAQPVDNEVRLRLAGVEPDPTRAAALYAAVLSSDPANTTALVNLGAIYGAAGRGSEAAALWKRALETNPALEGAALNLSRVLPRADARSVVERYLGFNPGSKAARERLEELARP